MTGPGTPAPEQTVGRPTIEDVAVQAGVSVATVSRALRDLPNVSPATRARVVAVARELDYRADPSAARLATGRTMTIGVTVPLPISWYIAQVVAGVEAVLSEAGYDLLLYAVDSPGSRRRVLGDILPRRRRVDAVVLVDLALPPAEVDDLVAGHATVVTIGDRVATFDAVSTDNHLAARRAVRHLLDLGHRRVGLIGDSPDGGLEFSVPGARREGFLAELAAAGGDREPVLERSGGFSVDGGAEAMGRLLDLPDPPTAVFAMSDEMAIGALKVLREAGLDCPGDVSVIGIDDHELADAFGLTTMRQQVVEYGARSARLALRRLADPTAPVEHQLCDTTLVVRRSTGPAPAGA